MLARKRQVGCGHPSTQHKRHSRTVALGQRHRLVLLSNLFWPLQPAKMEKAIDTDRRLHILQRWTNPAHWARTSGDRSDGGAEVAG